MNKRAFKIITYLIALIAFLSYVSFAWAGIGAEPTITELEIVPGHAKTGSFRVANSGEETVLVNVEIEDWLKVRTGGSPVDVKEWFIMDETEFELEPAEIKNITYQIIAPEGVEGELVAMVFFSSAVSGGGALGITGKFGVSVYAGIEGTQRVDAEIENIDIYDSTMAIAVKNRGNVHIRPSGRIVIKDSDGQLIDEVEIPYYAVIFAGKSHIYPLDLSKRNLTSGNYDIEAIFDTGTIYKKNKTFKKTSSFYLE